MCGLRSFEGCAYHGRSSVMKRGLRASRLRSLGLVAALLFGVAAPMASATAEEEQGAGLGGPFSVVQMVHTPNWPVATDVNPWDGGSGGPFTYRGIPCAGNAPVNNIASDLPTYNTRVPGSRSPASTRAQPMQFTVQ